MDRIRLRIAAVAALFAIWVVVGATGTVSANDPVRIAYARQLPDGGAQIFTANTDGTGEQLVPLPELPEDFATPVWSPDGSRLLISNILRPDSNGGLLPFRPATVKPDGSDYHLVPTPDAPFDMYCHVWSADGTHLICGFGGDEPGAFSVRADTGGDAVRLTTNPFGSIDQPWTLSPDGQQFAFLRYRPGAMPGPRPDVTQQVGIFVANVDGSNVRQVVPYGFAEAHEFASASWSHDGRRIISSSRNGRLFTVNVDGTGLRQISLDIGSSSYFAFEPAWSADVGRIAFAMFFAGHEDLYTADPTGRNVRQITDDPGFEDGPDWSPSQ
jgi:Tol biopolymer transport system component